MNLPLPIHDITVRVEGKPGSGKSAFTNWMHHELLKHGLRIIIVDEHVTRIIEESRNTNMTLRPDELADIAHKFIKSLSDSGLNPWDKKIVIATANTLVDIEVRRHMRDKDAKSNRPPI